MRDRRRPQNENLSVVYCFLGRGCDMEYDDKRENQTLQKKETDDVKMHWLWSLTCLVTSQAIISSWNENRSEPFKINLFDIFGNIRHVDGTLIIKFKFFFIRIPLTDRIWCTGPLSWLSLYLFNHHWPRFKWRWTLIKHDPKITMLRFVVHWRHRIWVTKTCLFRSSSQSSQTISIFFSFSYTPYSFHTDTAEFANIVQKLLPSYCIAFSLCNKMRLVGWCLHPGQSRNMTMNVHIAILHLIHFISSNWLL